MAQDYGRILIATLGHVDHGKSTLVKTLTGIDPDRLPEEKVLEGTTDLGFAFFKALNSKLYGFIDVPGHRDYIKNLIVGILNAHFYILVVDAYEGIMPQTVEHIQIIKCLRMKYGIVVISKIDMVEEVKANEVVEEVKLLYRENNLEMVPYVFVSFVKNIGVEELKKILTQALERTPVKVNEHGFVLAVMRTFSSRGLGTIVTGPVIQGRVGEGQTVYTINGKKSIVRNINIFKNKVDTAFAGVTAALNVPDFEIDDVRRGTVLTDQQGIQGVDDILILMYHSDGFSKYKGKKSLSVVMFMLTFRAECKVFFIKHFDGFSLCRVKFPQKTSIFSLNRFICYTKDLKELIGAGEVLYVNVNEIKIKDFNASFANNFEYAKYESNKLFYLLNTVLNICGFLNAKELNNILNLTFSELGNITSSNCEDIKIFNNDLVISVNTARQIVKSVIDAYHKSNPYEYGISLQNISLKIDLEQDTLKSILNDMVNNNEIEEYKGLYRLTNFKIAANKKVDELIDKLRNIFLENSFITFSQDELLQFIPEQKVFAVAFERLKSEQEIIHIGGNRWISKEGLDKVIGILRKNKDKFNNGFSPKEVKSFFGDLSRKHLIPILEYLDRIGVTRRVQDKRFLL